MSDVSEHADGAKFLHPLKMRSILFLVALLSAVSLPADPPSEPRERPRITEKIKQALKERARRTSTENLSANENAEDVVELSAIQVFAHDRYFVFDHEKQILESKPFTWRDGGTISRHVGKNATTEWMFQYDPRNNAIKFLSISF